MIGNTRWHWCFQNDSTWHFAHELPQLRNLLLRRDSLVAWASVGKIPEGDFLDPKLRITLRDVPLNGIPEWLGIDRALGAWSAFKRANCDHEQFKGLLLVDAGTILSLTRITAKGEFAGGQLVAGLHQQLFAMSNGAKNLRQVPFVGIPDEMFPFRTDEAMQRGVIQALVGTILQAQREADLPLWICGGDGSLLANQIREKGLEINLFPQLVLEGMVDIYDRISQGLDQ